MESKVGRVFVSDMGRAWVVRAINGDTVVIECMDDTRVITYQELGEHYVEM
jgi:hypothetical protein